jgi:hypothetical protein
VIIVTVLVVLGHSHYVFGLIWPVGQSVWWQPISRKLSDRYGLLWASQFWPFKIIFNIHI